MSPRDGRRGSGRPGRVALVLLLLAWMLITAASPAAGHASTQLPHATLEVEGNRLLVTWTADADDAADVGVALGLLEEDVVWTILDGEDFGPELLATLDAAFASDDALAGYLREHLQVRQDGEACPAEVERIEDFVFTGATLAFTCPDPIGEIDLRITMLHDRDPAYRTFAVDGTERFSLHTASAPEHRWDLSREPTGAARPEPVLLVGLVITVLVGGLGLWRWLPRAARTTPARDRPPRTPSTRRRR